MQLDAAPSREASVAAVRHRGWPRRCRSQGAAIAHYLLITVRQGGRYSSGLKVFCLRDALLVVKLVVSADDAVATTVVASAKEAGARITLDRTARAVFNAAPLRVVPCGSTKVAVYELPSMPAGTGLSMLAPDDYLKLVEPDVVGDPKGLRAAYSPSARPCTIRPRSRRRPSAWTQSSMVTKTVRLRPIAHSVCSPLHLLSIAHSPSPAHCCSSRPQD